MDKSESEFFAATRGEALQNLAGCFLHREAGEVPIELQDSLIESLGLQGYVEIVAICAFYKFIAAIAGAFGVIAMTFMDFSGKPSLIASQLSPLSTLLKTPFSSVPT